MQLKLILLLIQLYFIKPGSAEAVKVKAEIEKIKADHLDPSETSHVDKVLGHIDEHHAGILSLIGEPPEQPPAATPAPVETPQTPGVEATGGTNTPVPVVPEKPTPAPVPATPAPPSAPAPGNGNPDPAAPAPASTPEPESGSQEPAGAAASSPADASSSSTAPSAPAPASAPPAGQ